MPAAVEAAAVPIHLPLPPEVRGFYWTTATAGSKRAEALMAEAKQTGLNAIVIDIKNDDGSLGFAPRDPSLAPYAPVHPPIKDLEGVLGQLKTAGFYRIARLVVMRDGAMALVHPSAALHATNGSVWRDKVGTAWVNPADPLVRQTALALAREAYARGFDEIQFDYVRFPSDGVLSRIAYPAKQNPLSVMQGFFKDVGSALRADGIPVSFDLFGMTYITADDFGIGQRLQDVMPYADFVSPMAYPSHYVNGFDGHKNPALFPYEVVKKTIDSGAVLLAPAADTRQKTRPWLQDFDIGAAYGPAQVEAQIKAVRDGGGEGFLIWNARNVYDAGQYGPQIKTAAAPSGAAATK